MIIKSFCFLISVFLCCKGQYIQTHGSSTWTLNNVNNHFGGDVGGGGGGVAAKPNENGGDIAGGGGKRGNIYNISLHGTNINVIHYNLFFD